QELTGDAVTVADRIIVGSRGGASAVSVSAAGLIAYRTGGSNLHQLAWFDRSGKVLSTLGAPDETLRTRRLSPDGRRVAAGRTVQNNADIWIVDDTRTARFTVDKGWDRDPIWSPDGSRIVFGSDRKGVFNLYQKPSSGAGSEELLV